MTQIAVVTGSSYGLGKSISEELLAKGYRVYGISRSKPHIQSPKFSWISADLCKTADIARIPNAIAESAIDILVNNAGHVFPLKTLQYSDRAFKNMFSLNFQAHAKVTSLLFPRLNKGLIINISSDSDRSPDPELALYGSSKAALNLYFETMAKEYRNVQIISLLPTYMDTPFLRTFYRNNTKFDWRKALDPDDVAGFLMYIISHRKKFESGSRVMVLKNEHKDGIYNPEKLWVYTTTNKKLVKRYK